MKFCGNIEIKAFDIYQEIVDIANTILWRSYKDEALDNVYKNNKEKYSFTELKDLKDHHFTEFCKLKSH